MDKNEQKTEKKIKQGFKKDKKLIKEKIKIYIFELNKRRNLRTKKLKFYI